LTASAGSAGDLNGDLRPDIVTAGEGSNSVSVLRGSAMGAFTGPVGYGLAGGRGERGHPKGDQGAQGPTA
jgi:hypothetical protein